MKRQRTAKPKGGRKSPLWAEHESLVTAWAEAPSGPGWSNQLIWMLLRSRTDGSLRLDALQREYWPHDAFPLFAYSCLASKQMTAAIEACRLGKVPGHDR